MKAFIDNVWVLAFERCVIGKLQSLFNLDMVFDFAEDRIIQLAAESEENVAERARCTYKLASLEAGLSNSSMRFLMEVRTMSRAPCTRRSKTPTIKDH